MLLYNGDCTDEVKRNFNGKVVGQYRYTFTRESKSQSHKAGEEVEVSCMQRPVERIYRSQVIKGFALIS